MKHALLGLAAAATVLAIPAIAEAYPGWVTQPLNMRTCDSVGCPVVAVMPQGAAVDVGYATEDWDYVTYGGYAGYAAAAYINTGIVAPNAPVSYPPVAYPPVVVAPYPIFPAPHDGYRREPQWDARYAAWF